jgi:hypothetical protein
MANKFHFKPIPMVRQVAHFARNPYYEKTGLIYH